MDDTDIVYEITEDRMSIEKEYNVIARGMAYAWGTYSERVTGVLKNCGICYSRTTKSTEKFDIPENWLTWHPTCHHKNPKLMDLANSFLYDNTWERCRLFYLWGHSYEFNYDNNWDVIEEFGKLVGNRDDIWYATNIEIYDYTKAYESLQTSYDKKIIHNPSSTDVWAYINGETIKIKAGETLHI